MTIRKRPVPAAPLALRTQRSLLRIVLLLTLVLGGAACRDDSGSPFVPENPDLLEADTSPVVGTIQGLFAVSPTGEATYSLPLAVPPGAAGMQPSLAVTYDSASGNGVLGMGFSLIGLSAIARCPLTMAQDGRVRAVRDDAEDGICLDGARLVPVSESSGVTEYRTFPDSFAKVLGAPSDVASNTAATWKVFTRSGRILEYGGSVESSVMGRNGVIRSWLLRRASDRSGNTIDYAYANRTGTDGHTVEYAPRRIDYTGNQGVLPSRAVQFSYAPRAPSDRRTLFAGGLALESSQQLAGIAMLGPGGVLVREYRFAYKTGQGTGRTILRNIKECAGDGSCKPRTSFAWYGGRNDFEAIATPVAVPHSRLSAPMMMDVTGDGLDDLVVPTVPFNVMAHSDLPTTAWTVTPNRGPSAEKGAGFFQGSTVAFVEDHDDAANDPILQQQPDLEVQADYGTPIDYNQDGLADVLVHNVHGTAFKAKATWQVLLATAQHTFTLKDTGIPRPKHLLDDAPRLESHEASAHLADVNGDGIADLIQCERDTSAGGGDAFSWTLRLWTPAGPGFETTPRAVPALALFHCAWEIQPVDLDADGKVDLVLPEISQNQVLPREDRFTLSYEEGSDTWEKESIGSFGASGGARYFLDVNGDGLPDVVQIGAMTGRPETIFNTGDRTGKRFGAPILAVVDTIAGDFASLFGLAAVLDANGDGRQDLLVPSIDISGSFASWVLLQSTDTGIFVLRSPAIFFDEELSTQGATLANRLGPRVTDVDGDGSPDVVLPIGDTFQVFRSLVSHQDLLLSIHDGLNAHDPMDAGNVPDLAVEYGTLVDGEEADYVSKGWFLPSCTYPLRCVVGPRSVVKGVARNNGADGLRRSRVQYRGGRYDRLGRGFLGFEGVITTDLDTSAGTLDLYGDALAVKIGAATIYPAAGELQRQVRWTPDPRMDDPGRVALSFTSIAREMRKTGGSATYFRMPVEVSRSRRQGSWSGGGAQSFLSWLRLSAEADSTLISGVTITTTEYDDYGTVLASVTSAPGVDLTTTLSDVVVENHADSWLIGQVTSRKECSSAEGLTQCRTVTHSYDATTGLISGTVLDGSDATMHLALSYERDGFGNVVVMTAEDGLSAPRKVHTPYEPSGTFPVSIENALGHVVTLGFDPGFGVMTSRVDENKLTTQWEYDGFGRWIRELRPDGTQTKRTFLRSKDGGTAHDAWTASATTVTDGGEDTAVEYDGLGRPIRWWVRGTKTGADPAPRLMQEVAFDALGEHVARRSTLLDEGAPAESRHDDTYSWDLTGRLIHHKAPWGAITTYDYDGKQVHVTDPLKQVTTLENDAIGRLVAVTDPTAGLTSYTYGPFGALRTVTDPGGAVTTLLRDAFGRVRTSIDPDKGTTVMEYDGFGELTSSLDAQGRTSIFHYDALGRLFERDDQAQGGPIEATRWVWDKAPFGTDGALAKGALASVTAPDGTAITHTYDDLGRPSTIERLIGGESFDTALKYDDFGRIAKVTYPEVSGLTPFAVTNEYDPHGHLLAVRNAAAQDKSAPPYWRLTRTDSANRTQVEAFGNGFSTTRLYDDARDRLTSIVTAKDAQAPVQNLAYTYDAKLNLATRHDGLQSENATESFQYDALDRLTCATFSSSPTCPIADRYAYAPNGNLTAKPGIPGIYTYDPDHPHAVKEAGGESFVHDLTGNPISRAGVTVTYTAFDMPKTFTPPAGIGKTLVTLDYDGEQARVRKIAGDETTIYAGDLYERTTNTGTGAVEHRYFVYGNERVVAIVTRPPGATQTKAEQTRYLHVDHLGSVETVTGETGSKAVEKRSYDAFGERRNPAWGSAPGNLASGITQGFGGHEDDAELGLVNMKGRLYDPHLGRFLTPDPLVSHPAFGQSWNPYSYVLNNPLAYTDPSGFKDDPVNPTSGGSTYVYLDDTSQYSVRSIPGTAPTARPTPPPPPRAPPEPNVDASLAGLGAAPTDLRATGNTTPGVPSPPASGTPGGLASRVNTHRQASPPGFDPSGGKSKTEIAGELVRGAASGLGQEVVSVLSRELLKLPTELADAVGPFWDSGDSSAGFSALFWEPGVAQVDDLVESAIDGDFKGAAESGVKAITIGVATGVVLGRLGGAVVAAAKGVQEATKPTPRVSSKTLRGRWETETGRSWPKDPVSGRNQDVAHTKPLAEGGTNNVDNIEPLPHAEHVQRHREAGDFTRWGAKGAAAKKAGAE